MEEVFDLYYQRLYIYAVSMLNDEDEARDVVSGVMQSIWEDWHSERPKYLTPTVSVLYTMTRNRCLDILRHSKSKERYIAMMQATSDMADDGEAAEFEERLLAVKNAVDKLPEKTRNVLICTYYKKLSYKETALELDITENVVHKHMTKAFKLLKDLLKIVIIWYQIAIYFVK